MRQTIIGLVLMAIGAAACGGVQEADAADSPTTTTTTTTVAADVETTSPKTTTAEAPPPVSDRLRLPVPPPTSTPPLPTTTLPEEPPVFEYAIQPVTEDTVAYTWHEDCPIDWTELTLLTLSYWNFDERPVKGRMVVNNAVVDDVVGVFERLFEIKFPIERMTLVDDYLGDDKAAMRANITASFNCRYVDGTERWSNHAFGLAIDINPLINPWDREDNVLPLEGAPYTDRSRPIAGMINEGDNVIGVFEEFGWSWGGVWSSADYMHFSKPGN